jgi:long-chain acyl-CoA synthetase
VLTGLLESAAAERPRHTALVCGDVRLSYAQLAEQAARVAHGLAARGIHEGDAVALVLGNTPAFVAGFFGITGLGGVVVPLNPAFKRDELEFCFNACGVCAAITDGQAAAAVRRIAEDSEAPLQVIVAGGDANGDVSFERLVEDNGPVALDPRHPCDDAVYQFSSGSTGRPKRLARTHLQLCAEAETYTDWVRRDDRIFCAVPLFHTYGMGCCLLSAMRNAATLVMQEQPNPFVLTRGRAAELIEREAATVFPGVPFNFRLLAEMPGDADLGSLRLCFSAGTALPQATFDAFHERFGIPVRQLYGCTEAGTLTINLDSDPVATAASVGRPTGRVAVTIVDSEVAVRSPALTRGYAGMAELNRQVFPGDWFFTGDLGRLDDEGRLYLLGRKKLLIQVAGHKVDPIEVEDVVVSHPRVRDVCVVGVKGAVEGEEAVKAVVVGDDGFRERDLIRFCQERLATYKVPQIVERRDEIPKSPLGKVLRKYLV